MSFKDKCSSFASFLYNSDEKKVLGRGARSWAEIGIFYLIYYSLLAGFFVGMLAIFYQTVDENKPKLTGTDSLLKANPGMGFQPMPDVEYTLVRYTKDPNSYKDIVESIKKVLDPYKKAFDKGEGVKCDYGKPAPANKSCQVNYAELTKECNEANGFGYMGKISKPCILMRLNRIFDWTPEPYTKESAKEKGVSQAMQDMIFDNTTKNSADRIWIDCHGENPADRDNLGPIKYYPTQGFPHYFYPFKNQKGYMSPLVFVQFEKPPANIAMMVECQALAPNIRYDRSEKEGGVHFELLADP